MLYPLSYGDRDSNFRFLPRLATGRFPPWEATRHSTALRGKCGNHSNFAERRDSNDSIGRRRGRSTLLRYGGGHGHRPDRSCIIAAGGGTCQGGGACTAGRLRQRRGRAFARRSVPAAGRSLPGCPPLFPLSLWMLSCGDRSAENPQRQFRARAGTSTAGCLQQRRGRRGRVGLRRLPERFAGKSFGGPAQRRRYISSRNSALRSSTFVSRGFPGRQASA